MKMLMWKEWRENLKWVPFPGLVILLVFLIDKPDVPMPDTTDSYFFCLIAVVFAAALGFVQIFFEGHGDKRSLLLHRPLSASRIFLGKALAGIGLYLLALGIPFLCLESWLATPGNMAAPFHWQTSLPWLADILSGLVYYFAGMLVAQRDVSWYGSRCVPLAAALSCSCFVWALTEFWQALAAIACFTSVLGLAAWGSFGSGGACARQPRTGRIGLATTLLAGLLLVSMFAKQMIGEGLGSEFMYICDLTRQGRVLLAPCRANDGRIGPWLDARTGKEATDMNETVAESSMMAMWTIMETPLYQSYRNSGRFYVVCGNESTPGTERWFYDQEQRRLLGYHKLYHHFLGSFGPTGFTPAGEQPGDSFQGEFCHRRTRWYAMKRDFLAFPGAVYKVDYARRTIALFFAPAAEETVAYADWWSDKLHETKRLAVIGTDKSYHFLTDTGGPVVTIPRAHETHKDGYVVCLGLLETPERYFAWYRTLPFEPSLGAQEYKSKVLHLHQYDHRGRELACLDHHPPSAVASYAKAFFGLITPVTEAATLVATSAYLRSEARLQGNTHKPVLLDYLHNTRHYIPGTSRFEESSSGLIFSYIALIVLAGAASALVCCLLACRLALSRAHCIGWAAVGFLFGWVGLVLMVFYQEWPARIACPKCRKPRVVTRDLCENCSAGHAAPVSDGSEIFESAIAGPPAAWAVSLSPAGSARGIPARKECQLRSLGDRP
jgi:hypothetical protein